jgi:hypothetical protein
MLRVPALVRVLVIMLPRPTVRSGSDRLGGGRIIQNTPCLNLASSPWSTLPPLRQLAGFFHHRRAMVPPQFRMRLYTAHLNGGRSKTRLRVRTRRASRVSCAGRKLTLVCIGMMTSARAKPADDKT